MRSAFSAEFARQIADVRRHDGETLAEFAGARSFDRAVDGQHVGLDRNRGDGVDDLVDAAADLFERRHLFSAFLAGDDGIQNAFNQRLDICLVRREKTGDELHLLEACLRQRLGRLRSAFDLGDGGGGLLSGRALLLRAPGDLLKGRHDFAPTRD